MNHVVSGNGSGQILEMTGKFRLLREDILGQGSNHFTQFLEILSEFFLLGTQFLIE